MILTVRTWHLQLSAAWYNPVPPVTTLELQKLGTPDRAGPWLCKLWWAGRGEASLARNSHILPQLLSQQCLSPKKIRVPWGGAAQVWAWKKETQLSARLDSVCLGGQRESWPEGPPQRQPSLNFARGTVERSGVRKLGVQPQAQHLPACSAKSAPSCGAVGKGTRATRPGGPWGHLCCEGELAALGASGVQAVCGWCPG